jgi:hypothetical protein
MNFYSQSSTQVLARGERRAGDRKPLLRRLSIGLKGGDKIQGSTLDISHGGLSIKLERTLAQGTECALRFDVIVDGEVLRVAGVGTCVYCVCTGLSGFRIGMRFRALDENSQQAVTSYLRGFSEAVPMLIAV